MKIMMVGGDWGTPWRASGYLDKLSDACEAALPDAVWHVYNGGEFVALEPLVGLCDRYDVVIWFPNVDNAEEKLLGQIKKVNPKTILVSSKNNRAGKYDTIMLIARALQAKANLLIEFTDGEDGIAATILDPLGNVFLDKETDIKRVGSALVQRLRFLVGVKRVGSVRVGDAQEIPEVPKFFNLAREYGDRFHELIHAANQSRFLGARRYS